MIWGSLIVGFLLGALAGLEGDFSVADGALTGAVLGLVVGALLHGRRRRNLAAQAEGGMSAAPGQGPWQGPGGTLVERVESLEREVGVLRRELARLSGGAFGASASAPTDAVPDTLPDTLPISPSGTADAGAQTAPAASSPGEYALPAVSAASPVPAGMAAIPLEAAPPEHASGAPPASPAPGPREPNFADRLVQSCRDWLLGGNTVVRVGIVVLFFGIAFLLKYASDNDLLPIEFRLAGVALGATVLLVLGWRTARRRPTYGLVLQGGGVGLLYLDVFAATRLYTMLPVTLAFGLMVAICALSAFLAVRQNAAALAFMGSAGGFLAPVLLSNGSGNHVALFSYYALLNAGIFAIAWFKAWRPLNLLGFVFTFVIGTAWGVTSYRPSLLASTEPFLILFFLMYVGIALFYALRRELELKHYVDGSLVFGTPIVAAGLQAALMRNVPFGLAFSAVALAAFYLAVAALLARRRDRLGLLFQSTLALAVIFATLAVPFAFSGPTTSAAWVIEGAMLIWVRVRERRLVPFGFGLLMQLAAAGALFASVPPSLGADVLPVLNGHYIASLLIALAALFTGWWLHGRAEGREWYPWMPQIGLVAAAWGLLWWLGSGIDEILRWSAGHPSGAYDLRWQTQAISLFAAASAGLAWLVRRTLAWPLAGRAALALVPALSCFVLAAFVDGRTPLSGLGALSWPVAFAAAWALLRATQRDVEDRWLAPLHTLMFWNLCALLALEGFWRLRGYVPEGTWSLSAWAYGFGLLVLLVSSVGERLRWPVARFARAYQVWGVVPLVALLWAWSLASLASDGDASPLVWLPLLNPLDVAQLLIGVAVAIWLRCLRRHGVARYRVEFAYAAAATLFLWLNATLLRALHYWAGVPYAPEHMMHSTVVQASLSIFWTVCALAAMMVAARRVARLLWFAGAALLAVTIVKLFLFDLSYLQGIERIAAFIGIGVLLLLIGYFSPLPPRAGVTGEARS